MMLSTAGPNVSDQPMMDPAAQMGQTIMKTAPNANAMSVTGARQARCQAGVAEGLADALAGADVDDTEGPL